MYIVISEVVIDRHTIAAISIAGSLCDVLGGLYLAYDLLGGNNGPLRILTRVVTYSFLFFIGYGLPFSMVLEPIKALELGLVVGVGLGAILGLEYAHATLDTKRNQPHRYDRWIPFVSGSLRGVVFGVAGGLVEGPFFGVMFGFLSAIGLMVVYAFRLSPTDAYQPHIKPKLRLRELFASALRGIATAFSGVLSALLTNTNELGFGLEFGIVAGLISALISIFSPFVEWWADQLPARRMGAIGCIILLLGLLLQSIQYWVVLLNIVVQ